MNEALLRRLRAWLEFYQELGLGPFYRTRTRQPPAAPEFPHVASVAQETVEATELVFSPSVAAGLPRQAGPRALPLFGDTPGRIVGDTLEKIRADIGDCRRCKLWPHRTQIVFGVGHERAELVFIGEAPGVEEDRQGLPFVGRAGQLLNQWIEQLGRKRRQVYICNVIKCRPPSNRSPEKEEIQTCAQFLLRQLDVIQPKLICCLGSVALQTLVGKSVSISRYRGQFSDYRSTKLFATFHPAYLLRNPNADREVQQDLRKIRQFLAPASAGGPVP